MAWGSSAAQDTCARLAGDAGRVNRLGFLAALPDGASQGWLKLAGLVHLSLLAAAVPLGSELAIFAVTTGSAVALLLLFREAAAPARSSSLLDQDPPIRADRAEFESNGRANPVQVAQPARPADDVWRDIMGQISHELRTPLNAIIGFSDLMGRELYGPVGDPRYQEYLGHIRDSGRSLLKSAEDTLALTELLAHRGSDQETARVELDHLILGAIAGATHGSKAAGVRFDPHAARALDVQGDRRALHQIMLNVVAEAVERCGGNRDAVLVTVRETGARVLIDVTATALIGVATGEGCASGDATSLRLALARMMLELNGGSIADGPVAGSQGPGWRATLCLDLVRQPDLFNA